MSKKELRTEIMGCRMMAIIGAIWFLVGAFKMIPEPTTVFTMAIAVLVSYGWYIGGLFFMVMGAIGSHVATEKLQKKRTR